MTSFEYCSNLTNIDLPAELTEIGYMAFHGCISLKFIEIPSKVTYIQREAFYQCTALSTIILGESIQILAYHAFDELPNLETVLFLGKKNPQTYGVFQSHITVFVPFEYEDESFCGSEVVKGLPSITKELPIATIIDEPIRTNRIEFTYTNSYIQPSIPAALVTIEPTYIIFETIFDINITDTNNVNFNDDKSIITLFPDNFPSIEPNTLFVLNLPENTIKVSIPKSDKKIQITINSFNNKTVTIDAIKSEPSLIINCPKGANLLIPIDNKIILKGNGIISIDTPNNESSINISKIILNTPLSETNENSLILNSNEAFLNIEEIQISQEQKIVGQLKPKITACQIINVDHNSKLILEKMTVENVIIGYNSTVELHEESVNVYHFIVHYDDVQNENQYIPLKFIYPFPILNSSDIQIKKTANLQNNKQNITLAQFIGNQINQSYIACQDLHYIENDEFNYPECLNDDVDNTTKLIIRVNNNQMRQNTRNKGLTAGTIAGIVIGCVAVIAGVIILTIIFLKKKKGVSNESLSE